MTYTDIFNKSYVDDWQWDQPLGPLSLVFSRTATRSLSSSSLRKSRARTSSGASWVGCLRAEVENLRRKINTCRILLPAHSEQISNCIEFSSWLTRWQWTHWHTVYNPKLNSILTCTWSWCDPEDLDWSIAWTGHSNHLPLYPSLLSLAQMLALQL